MSPVKIHETKLLPLTELRLADWNPNVQSEEVFNSLYENIEDVGFDDPIVVRVLTADELAERPEDQVEAGVRYEIVGGHHRYKVMKLAGAELIPATVHEDWDLKRAKKQNVRRNIAVGKIDPVKFTQLWDDLAETGGVDPDLLKQQMGIMDEKTFNSVYHQVKRGLPKELRDKLPEMTGDLKKIEDLSLVLNTLFTRYGNTLDRSYMCFTWGGKVHWMVNLSKDGFRAMKAAEAYSAETDTDMNKIVADALQQFVLALHSQAVSQQLGGPVSDDAPPIEAESRAVVAVAAPPAAGPPTISDRELDALLAADPDATAGGDEEE
jgi:hypothetical protein